MRTDNVTATPLHYFSLTALNGLKLCANLALCLQSGAEFQLMPWKIPLRSGKGLNGWNWRNLAGPASPRDPMLLTDFW